MKNIRKLLLPFLLIAVFTSTAQPVLTPDKLYGYLFTEVQLTSIFPDGKTFPDCVPIKPHEKIRATYYLLKRDSAPTFNVKKFVTENFRLPEMGQVNIPPDSSIVAHINRLWPLLERKPDTTVTGSSLLPLPYSYIVPGGRFREIYYWDSYFTMLGLKESGRVDLIENMIKNFSFLIKQYGHIPNGNRSYYLSRSQPPFFAAMVTLLAGIKGDSVYATYLPFLQKEYEYWMDATAPTKHVVKLPDGSVLNRYYDQENIPRQESYKEDYLLYTTSNKPRQQLYRNVRSAAESGWDFSSRWFADGRSLNSIHTTNIIPVDLNCLLYHLEKTLAKANGFTGNTNKKKHYEQLAQKRLKSIEKYCWSAKNGWYTDYNIATKSASPELTLAGMYPFYFNMAGKNRIVLVKHRLENHFIKAGGVVTTLKRTGQQWDAPNGWAPLQWITITGLNNYNAPVLAQDIAIRWIRLNTTVYTKTGKLMEKYNVQDITLEAGGGEYPSQDGFGWTNGVLLALIKQYGLPGAKEK